jgi:hypothetical protein
MADPLSIIGLAITLVQVAASLYSYGTTISTRKEEIRRLLFECYALKGVLDSIPGSSGKSISRDARAVDEETWNSMASMTQDTLLAIQRRLQEPKGRLSAAKNALVWPFAKGDIDKYVVSLERSKSWFLMVMMNDVSDLTQNLYFDMKSLSEAIHEDILERKADKMQKDTEDIMLWLAPSRSDEEHAKFSRLRAPGSGEWFFDTRFHGWLNNPTNEQRFLWVTGKCKRLINSGARTC